MDISIMAIPSVGALRKYKTPEDIIPKIDAYFKYCKSEKKPCAVTKLAYFLGFASRQSLWDYKKRGDEVSYIIKRALLLIESGLEETLYSSNNTSITGAIFSLKANFRWRDQPDPAPINTQIIVHQAPETLGLSTAIQQQAKLVDNKGAE